MQFFSCLILSKSVARRVWKFLWKFSVHAWLSSSKTNFFTILISDINTKSGNWCIIDKTTYEGKKIDYLVSGLHKLIYQPTHILDRAFIY